tara:strand:- start:1651 stop:1779 length:129 start_codon:yes stop_codon:yes gene_type:complete
MKINDYSPDKQIVRLIDHILGELIEMKLNIEYLIEKVGETDV